jgi:hypothetical protein
MPRRLPALARLLSLGCLLLGAAACSRSAAVAPAEAPPAESPGAEATAAPPDGAPDSPVASFRLPDDRGGELLARLLPPAEARRPLADPPAPRHLPPPAGLNLPDPPPPPAAVALPRLPAAPRRAPLRPRLTLDELPAGAGVEPALPGAPTLPAGERARVPSPRPGEAAPLPALSPRPLPDRAPVEDVTAGESTAAVLAAPLPPRTAPAPYLRQTVPDPYENRRAARVAAPPEDANPVTAAPRPPRP